MLGIIAGASLLGGLYSAYKGHESLQGAYNPYDIGALRKEQSGASNLYNEQATGGREMQGFGRDMFATGQGLMDQGQEFFDIESGHNQLMRKTIMDDAMSQVALQDTLSRRNPNAQGSGIAAQNLRSSQLQGTKQSQDSFLQGYRQNMGIGQGLIGQGLQSQQGGMGVFGQGVSNIGGAASGQAGLAENIQQAMIANTELGNQQARDQAQYWSSMGSSAMNFGGSLLGMM